MICRDSPNRSCTFEATAIIEFMGSLQSPSSSSGHYRCDIKDPKSKLWFRTNDNTTPTQIEEEDVSKQGYIVLLTKKD